MTMAQGNATGAASVIATEDKQQGAIRTNSAGQVEQKLYFASGFTQYRPYIICRAGENANQPAGMAVATRAQGSYVCVPQGDTTTDEGWYWAVIEGVCTAACDGSNAIAEGAFLKVINAGTRFILDHDTVATQDAKAIAREALATGNDDKKIYLMGIHGRVHSS